MTDKNPYEIFQKECPELAERFNNLVEVQRSLKGLDQKTKQLINIAIQTSTKNSHGVKFHAIMAYKAGATKDEIIGSVVMNLHLTGLVTVLECLPAALEGVEEAIEMKSKTVESGPAGKKPKTSIIPVKRERAGK
jgi:alkylhydroperoxidase/carboxymuconolactone decarboxylase family protein YurZ